VDEAARGVEGRGRAEVCDLLKVRADYSDGEVAGFRWWVPAGV
jgi:hypothetical protein